MAEASHCKNTSSALTAGSEVTFDVVCTPCDNDGDIKEADRYCLYCKEYLCTTCLKYHNKLAGSKHHQLVDTDSVPGTQGTLPVSDVCTQRCEIHKDEVVKYYCPDHKTLGCGVCMIPTHNTCNDKLYIPDKANTLTVSEDFKRVQALIEKMTKLSDNIIKSSHANIKYSSECRVKALREMETFRKEINDVLDKLKVELEEQIEEMTTRDEAAMNGVSDKAGDVQAQLQQMSSEFDTLLSKGHNCQMFIEMKTSEDTLADLQRQLKEVEINSITAFMFKPNEDLHNLVVKKGALGELLLQNPHKTTAAHVADINVKSSRNKQTCRVNGASLLTKDRLVITDWKNSTVKLIDTKLQQIVSEYKPEQPPSDVTRVCSSRIAVTLPAARKIVFMKSEDALTLDNEICVDQRCWYIACIDDKLVVSIRDPHEVRILSLTGETLQTFSTFSTGEPMFRSKPLVTASTFTRAVYASDWGVNRVTMLDMDGVVIAEYKDDDLVNPAHSAVNDTGMVFLCGANSHNIHLLTPYCSKVKILLTEKDGIYGPSSVCYCAETSRLYIGMANNDIIKVYQLHAS